MGVLLVSASFGMVLKLIYSGFRQGHIDGCYYSLAAIYCLRIFYESVEKFGEMLVVLTFAFAIIRLGETVFNISRTKTSAELLPA